MMNVVITPAAAAAAGCRVQETVLPKSATWSFTGGFEDFTTTARGSQSIFTAIPAVGWKIKSFSAESTRTVKWDDQDEIVQRGYSYNNENPSRDFFEASRERKSAATSSDLEFFVGTIITDWASESKSTVTYNSDYGNVTACFEQTNEVEISTNVSPSGSGTVSGGGIYAIGSSVTLRASGNSGYSFWKWNDGTTSPTKTFTATSSITYTAYFKRSVQYSLSLVCDQVASLTDTALATILIPQSRTSVAEGSTVTIGYGMTMPYNPPGGIYYPYYAQLFSKLQYWENGVAQPEQSSFRTTVTDDTDFVGHFDLLAVDIDEVRIGSIVAELNNWKIVNQKGEEIATVEVLNSTCSYLQFPHVYYDKIGKRTCIIRITILPQFINRYTIDYIIDGDDRKITSTSGNVLTHTFDVDKYYKWNVNLSEHGIIYDPTTSKIMHNQSGILCYT